jgi:cellulose synthase/poly-beta-1,6-N-acetylglucosamine synthase-like glycosyltransferase
MHTKYTTDKLKMLCGLVSYNNKGNVFSMMQQAESVALVGISAFLLNSGRPATCNGANLMFSKLVFQYLGGYGEQKQLSSGDDDLLMQTFAAYQPDKVKFATNPSCIVYTKTEKSFKKFIQQRIRWAGKRRAYKFSYNTYLMLLLLFKQIVFWSALLFGVLFNSPLLFLVCLILLFADVLLVLRFKPILPMLWVAVFLMPFYQLYIPLIPVFSLLFKNTWKGREVVKA